MKITCSVCGKEVDRRPSEVKRCQARGLKTYCSRKCCGTGTFDNIPIDKRNHPEYLVANNREDELSPFRWHLNNCHRRKHHECDLSLEYLKELWEGQDGKCPYTGWQLKNLQNMGAMHQLPLTPDRASLDRIHSSKGYVKGNVQFVSYMAQVAKNKFEEGALIMFCEAVTMNVSGQNSKE